MTDKERERMEEDEVRLALRKGPIYLDENDLLTRDMQHLAAAIDRLTARGVLILLTEKDGRKRWASAKPWDMRW